MKENKNLQGKIFKEKISIPHGHTKWRIRGMLGHVSIEELISTIFEWLWSNLSGASLPCPRLSLTHVTFQPRIQQVIIYLKAKTKTPTSNNKWEDWSKKINNKEKFQARTTRKRILKNKTLKMRGWQSTGTRDTNNSYITTTS